jgi:glycosyltransferase involved in cell wall biosynthesis
MIDTRIVSGPGRQLAALAEHMAGRHAEFLVISFHRRGSPPSPYLTHLAERGIPYVVVQEACALDPRIVWRVHSLLRQWRPDIVQTHSYKATIVAGVLRCFRPPWRWIGFWHGATTEDFKVRAYHFLDRLMLRGADRVVVVSRQQLTLFAALGARVALVQNAVVPMTPSRSEDDVCPELVELPRPLLGVVGRLSSEKGVDVFLHACMLLCAEGLPFSAIIVGDGPDRQNLEMLRDRLGLSARVRFLGSMEKMRRVYTAIDVLVIPSRSEGLPNVLLEAIAADVPVAATNVGSISEVLDDPQLGILVPPEDPAMLARAIQSALRIGPETQVRSARRRVVERYSLSRRVETHIALYRATLSGHSGS